jgi:DNA invertase Pin-like site-specific DNA recombinase
MRAAIYLRVSTAAQEDSPERQLSQVRPFCQRKGYRVVKEYTDLAERGWDDSRPAFQKLLRDAAAGLFDVVVVDEVSRLSRNSHFDYIRFVAGPLVDAKVAVDSVAQGLQKPDEIVGGILTVVQQAQAHGESTTLSRRVITQFEKMAREGVIVTGKPPFAYRRVWEGGRPRLVPGDPAQVEAVKFIFSAYDEHDVSLVGLRRRLEERGVLSPGGLPRWSTATIYQILTDETYVGSYVFNRNHCGRYHRLANGAVAESDNKQRRYVRNPKGDWFVRPCAHEPLVDPEVFRRVQEKLKANRRRTTPLPERGGFLLSKLLVCDACGGWMCGHRDRRDKRGLVVYRCGRAVAEGRCRLNIVAEEEVALKIIAALKERFLSPSFLDRLRAEARRIDELAAAPGTAKALADEIAGLDRKLDRAKRNLALLDEDLVPSVVAEIRGWEARKAQAEAELAECASPAFCGKMESLIHNLEGRLGRMEEALYGGARESLRAVLRESVAWVRLRVNAVPFRKNGCKYSLAGGEVVLHSGDTLGRAVAPSGSFNLLPASRSGT